MQLFFIRPGQANYKRPGLCNADPSRDVRLTEEGRPQAQSATAGFNSLMTKMLVMRLEWVYTFDGHRYLNGK